MQRDDDLLGTGTDRVRLELAADLAGLGFFEFDPEGRTPPAISERLFELFGCVREAGLAPDDLYRRGLAPEEAERTSVAFEQALRERGEIRLRQRIVRASDGVPRWIETRARGVAAPDGGAPRLVGVCADVTERVESADQDASALGSILLDELPIGVTVARRDGAFVAVNKAVAASLGYSQDELLGMRVQDIVTDVGPEQLRQRRERYLDNEGRATYAVKHRAKDGRVIESYLMLKRLALGTDTVSLGAWIDVTERNRALAALALAQKRLENALAAGQMGTWELDCDSRRLVWNEEMFKLWGMVPRDSEVLFDEVLAQVLEEDRALLVDAIKATCDHGQPLSVVFRVTPVDGGVRWMRARGVSAGGEGRRVFGVTFDVTAGKQVELDLREAHQRLELLVEHTPLGVIMWDSDLRVRQWAGEAERIFGWRADEMIGRRLGQTGLPYEQDAHDVDALTAAIRSGERRYLVIANRCWTRSRRIIHCEWYNSVVTDDRGEFSAMLSLVLDVTDRKRYEEELRIANVRKDEFLAVLAHELRNPLAPVKNSARLLRRLDLPEPATRAVTIIERQLGHMARLLDDLLDVARITQSRLELRRSRVDVRVVLEQAIEQSRPLLEAARQALVLSMPPERLTVDGDPTRLAQVFANLLNNAAKYSDGPGSVQISARAEGAWAFVTVADTGIGIAREALARLFDMFSQVHPERSVSAGGLGIGLSLVKGLVELHGGAVEATSEGPGRGSVFRVTLPLAPPAMERAGGETRVDRRAQGPLRVLVVDDNVDSAESMAVLLRASGHEVAVAFRGEEGVAAAERFAPQVVLLDIGMPDITGYEVARRLREVESGRGGHDPARCDRMLIIAMTGWGQSEDKRRAMAAGFDHHFTKPIDLDRLDAVLAGLGAAAAHS